MKFPACFRVLCKANHGAAFIELALVSPLLLLLLFGAIDFGRGFFVGLEVANAAHAGAEFGSENPSGTVTEISAAASQSAPNLSNLTVSTPTWGCECSDGSLYSANCTVTPVCVASSTRSSTSVRKIQVTATAVYHPLLPWPHIPSSITLTQTATIRGN
jgi:Flp pilus assembly protein TadG